MINIGKQVWILEGYKLFAKGGPNELKVEVIARKVGKSKSSFYHHFADLEIFTEMLLSYHQEQSTIIAKRESLCQNVVPDLLNLMIEVKQDLFFNRQLRINRDVPAFRKCFEQTNKEVGGAIIEIWADMLGLSHHSNLAQIVLKLSLENFFLQITEETMTYEWLLNYVQELKNMVRAFQNSKPGG